MPKSFSINDPVAASAIVTQNNQLANHPLNAFSVPTRVSLYAAATLADINILNFQIGDSIHSKDLIVPIAAAVSMRDHLVAQGVALPGQRLGIAYQNTNVALNTFRTQWILEELA